MQKHYKKSLKTQGFLNPERFVYFSGETPSQPETTETTPQEEEKPKEKPKALTDAQKRNATRSQAKRVAGLLRKLPENAGDDLATKIDEQYEESRKAEIALNLQEAIANTNELRSLLVRGQIRLSAHNEPDQSAASQYWDRELGLDKERASEAKKKAEDEEVERRAAIELPGLGDQDRLASTPEEFQRQQDMMARVEKEREKESENSSSMRTETAAAPGPVNVTETEGGTEGKLSGSIEDVRILDGTDSIIRHIFERSGAISSGKIDTADVSKISEDATRQIRQYLNAHNSTLSGSSSFTHIHQYYDYGKSKNQYQTISVTVDSTGAATVNVYEPADSEPPVPEVDPKIATVLEVDRRIAQDAKRHFNRLPRNSKTPEALNQVLNDYLAGTLSNFSDDQKKYLAGYVKNDKLGDLAFSVSFNDNSFDVSVENAKEKEQVRENVTKQIRSLMNERAINRFDTGNGNVTAEQLKGQMDAYLAVYNKLTPFQKSYLNGYVVKNSGIKTKSGQFAYEVKFGPVGYEVTIEKK